MHDIWNPWHGCVRVSPGCANCYMYYLDQQRDRDGSRISRTGNFAYPLQRDQAGRYRVAGNAGEEPSGHGCGNCLQAEGNDV